MGVYVTQDWNLEKGKMVSNTPFDAYQSHENEGKGPPKMKSLIFAWNFWEFWLNGEHSYYEWDRKTGSNNHCSNNY